MEDKIEEGFFRRKKRKRFSGGDFDINNPNPILKVFCYNCGSDNLTKGM